MRITRNGVKECEGVCQRNREEKKGSGEKGNIAREANNKEEALVE